MFKLCYRQPTAVVGLLVGYRILLLLLFNSRDNYFKICVRCEIVRLQL